MQGCAGHVSRVQALHILWELLGTSANMFKHLKHIWRKKTRQLTSKALALLQRMIFPSGCPTGYKKALLQDHRIILSATPSWQSYLLEYKYHMIYDCEEPTQAIYNDLLFQGGYLEPELRQSSSVQRHWVKGNLSISSWRLYDKNILLLTLKTGTTKCRFVGTMQWWNLEIPKHFWIWDL